MQPHKKLKIKKAKLKIKKVDGVDGLSRQVVAGEAGGQVGNDFVNDCV